MNNVLAAGGAFRYLLKARDGQFLYVRPTYENPALSCETLYPAGSHLLDKMDPEGDYRGQLWQSGDHVVEIVNLGDSSVPYGVIVGIE